MADGIRALIAGTEVQVFDGLTQVLEECGTNSVSAASVGDAMNTLAAEDVTVVFCAADLADGSYRDLIRKLKLAKQRVPVVVVSRLGEWNEYLDAIGFGAFDCIAPPYRRSEVQRIIGNALQAQHQEIAISAGAR